MNAKIAELAGDIKELKSEKSMLLDFLNCTGNVGLSLKKDMKDKESSLFKLEQRVEKYASELEVSLSKYSAITEWGVDHDSTELYGRRMSLCPDKTAIAAQRIQPAYGEKYDPLVMFDSKQER